MESPLGLASGTVRVVPYDATWPRMYAAEVSRLLPFLDREGVTLLFEHTGSTSIRFTTWRTPLTLAEKGWPNVGN